MSVRRLSIRNLFVICVGIALLAVVVRLADSPEPTDFTDLRVGTNELELRAGDYVVYWMTLAHPDEEAEFSDFEFSLSPSGASINEPRFLDLVPIGDDGAYVVFNVGDLRVREGGTYSLRIAFAGAVPEGRPVFKRQ